MHPSPQPPQPRVLLAVLLAIVLVGAVFYLVWTKGPGIWGPEDAQGTVGEQGTVDYPGPGTQETQVTVVAGTTPEQLGTALLDAGVVASVPAFVDAYAANPAAPSIAPGVYNLFREMKASQAVDALVNLDNRAVLSVDIRAGLTHAEIVAELSKVTGLTTPQITEALADTAAAGLPAEAAGSYEGWLEPGVYDFAVDTTPPEMVAQMIARTVATLDGLGVAPEDRQAVLIKASLVQREATRPEYFPMVASLIDNRLSKDLTLDLESTIRYVLGPSDSVLTQDDLAVDSPFNTFQHKGLPPTPIASPSAEALAAVLAPAETAYLYSVVVDPMTEDMRFVTTYPEYQKVVKERQAALDADE